MSYKKISIAIVDDHTLFRSGLSSLMAEFNEIDVAFTAENGADFQTSIKKHGQVDVVLMDVNMPIMDGYATTKWIKNTYPNTKVLAISMLEDEKTIITMIKSGASGYILKESRPLDLLAAIKVVLEKGYYLNNLVNGLLLNNLFQENPKPPFNNRELTFLQLCSSDLTYKEIAARMNVSPRTVDNYRETLFIRLGIKSRIGLVVYGIKNGLIKI